MKIVHTSDWHLGHSLYNYDRTEEQMCMLKQLTEMVARERPDAFLLCGDVYHTPQPSAAVQTLFADAMAALHTAHPGMTIIVTAGNHDSGSKHEIFRTPWRALNVHVVGTLEKEPELIDQHIIEIEEKGFVIAIPYSYERNFPEGFFQNLLNRVKERNRMNLPVVMMAHTTVKGCDFRGHDRTGEFMVGGIDCLDLADLGEGYDYLALGHIHHAQFVQGGNHRARYSGSPLPVSFDEDYPHSVTWVNLKAHGETPEVSTEEIANPHPLVTLPSGGFANWQGAKELLRNFPDDIPAYIRLNVEVEDFLPPDAPQEAAALTLGKQCRFCLINTQRIFREQEESRRMLTVQEFQAEAPIEIARRYAGDVGICFDSELEELFMESLKEVEADKRNV